MSGSASRCGVFEWQPAVKRLVVRVSGLAAVFDCICHNDALVILQSQRTNIYTSYLLEVSQRTRTGTAGWPDWEALAPIVTPSGASVNNEPRYGQAKWHQGQRSAKHRAGAAPCRMQWGGEEVPADKIRPRLEQKAGRLSHIDRRLSSIGTDLALTNSRRRSVGQKSSLIQFRLCRPQRWSKWLRWQ